jgi:CRP/FNR family transcriptional regulator, cyclic AMP receptor protein
VKTIGSALEQLARVPLFSACNRAELALIMSNSTPVRIPAGRTIAAEGAFGREFLVITVGTASVSIGGRLIVTLGPGDFLGEISLLDGGVRTATVTADTDVIAHVCNEREFRQLVENAPHLARRLLVGLARRLRATDELLNT